MVNARLSSTSPMGKLFLAGFTITAEGTFDPEGKPAKLDSALFEQFKAQFGLEEIAEPKPQDDPGAKPKK